MTGFLNKGEALSLIPDSLKSDNAQANDILDALNIIIQLRNSDGVERVNGEIQWIVALKQYRRSVRLELLRVKSFDAKIGIISPAFASKQFASDAVKSIGEWKITKAIQTLSGI